MTNQPAPPVDDAPVIAPLVVDYAPQRPVNRPATASLVWGLLLFVPFIAGILAIRFGRRGRTLARTLGGEGRDRARFGLFLGWVNIVLSSLFVMTLPFAAIRARQAAEITQCMSQLGQIGLARMMYATANGGQLPSSFDELVSGRYIRPFAFVCPACAHDASKPIGTAAFGAESYVYMHPAERVGLIASPANTVLTYEPLTDHARGINVGFVDGHVTFYPTPTGRK